jgi:Xaa-Pro aminopeptidase
MTSTLTQHTNLNTQHADEIAHKLTLLRAALDETEAAGVRLRGTDWFSWVTAGATHTVVLAAETGVAEVLVTSGGAWIITNEIEAPRFNAEELPGRNDLSGGFDLFAPAWADPTATATFIRDVTGGGRIISDRPVPPLGDRVRAEAALPASLVNHKRILLPNELERYRQVGRLASEAMTEVLFNAQPDWTEYQLAGAGANALWSRGLHPMLTLAAGERRLPLYRHPTPTAERIGRIAMLVFCARGFGLVVSLTRFVCFSSLTPDEANLHQQVREIEAAALDRCKPGIPLSEIYQTLAESYTQHGFPNAIREHHQGGTAGYLPREIIATPSTSDVLAANMAIAWNPSLPGAKIEDTFVISEDGTLENLTLDPNWQSAEIEGRLRPLVVER